MTRMSAWPTMKAGLKFLSCPGLTCEGRKSSLVGAHFPRSPSVNSHGGTEAEAGTQVAKVPVSGDGRW